MTMHDLSRPAPHFSRRRTACAIAAAFTLAGCASLPDAKAPEAAAAQAAATVAAQASAAPAPAPAAPRAGQAAAAAAQSSKPFAEVIKDAKEHPGLFPLWTKDDKVWIELKPEQFDAPFFFSVNLSRGLGERAIFGGLMGASHLVEFHRVGNNVQLL